MRITHAYCVELDEVVTIDAARRAYLSNDPLPPRYHFQCSDAACRKKCAVVTGVNYTFNAEDSIKFRAAHFAARYPEKHGPDCEWRERERTEAVDTPVEGEPLEHTLERMAMRKLTDRITDFDPRDPDTDLGEIEAPTQIDPPQPITPRPESPRTPDSNRINRRTRTRDLERLVQTYREARAELSEAELRALHINITGVGRLRLIDYFRPLQYCTDQTTGKIINGGAHFDQNYGQGFRLKMIDRINQLPVFVYVSPDMMKTYRHRKYIRDIVDEIPARKNVRVYVNGTLQLAPNGKSYTLGFGHLRHLALVLGAKLESAENDA